VPVTLVCFAQRLPLAADALAVGLGVAARRSSGQGHPEHRLASRGLVMGAVVLALVLVPNLVGRLLTVW
jgi:hypothetical protein